MIGARYAGGGKDLAGKGAEAALHPIAHDGAADLLRNGDAEPHYGIIVLALADEQDEAGHRRAAAAVRGQEVRAARERG
jgi:hypothetical protein